MKYTLTDSSTVRGGMHNNQMRHFNEWPKNQRNVNTEYQWKFI